MNLANEKQVVIGGNVVDVEPGGGVIFSASGLRFCAATGRGLNFHGEPFGPQLAFKVAPECVGCMSTECFCGDTNDYITKDSAGWSAQFGPMRPLTTRFSWGYG